MTGYYLECSCGWSEGPYRGTMWRTPEEHAKQAQGGHMKGCDGDIGVVQRE